MKERKKMIDLSEGSARRAMLLIGGLTLSSMILSAALAAVALRPRPVVVVPGVPREQVVLPEEIPDGSVRAFGLFYLSLFDTYTPSTVEERSNYLLRFVAPELLETVVKSLTERATYAARARESASLVLPLPEACEVERLAGGQVRFAATAERRLHIAGSLKSKESVRYVLDLRAALPSDLDPYGFVVVGQSVRTEDRQEAADEK